MEYKDWEYWHPPYPVTIEDSETFLPIGIGWPDGTFTPAQPSNVGSVVVLRNENGGEEICTIVWDGAAPREGTHSRGLLLDDYFIFNKKTPRRVRKHVTGETEADQPAR